MRDVQGRCPACGAASLFLGEGGHVTCARIECPNPCAADDLLHGGEAALAQALGGDRAARVIAYNLHCHGHSLAEVRRMTDEEFRAVPGIGDTSLATIRQAFPAQPPGEPQGQPPVVATARIDLDVVPACDTVLVPQEAFDRLVRVAMWVSRGQSMAHTPDPSPVVGARYPDTAARKALGALDDAGLLDVYRQAAAEEAPDA
ncbi:hypothetical protein ACFWNF_15800 [Streptomyces anulatus]|uniref:hypothetical protein n=1 Tax=Streptomyces anulatus TaxID=1892 RepID=UPI0036647149